MSEPARSTDAFQIRTGKPGVEVKIKPDGTIEYGENYNPDKIARAFWEVVASYLPGPLAALGDRADRAERRVQELEGEGVFLTAREAFAVYEKLIHRPEPRNDHLLDDAFEKIRAAAQEAGE